MQPLTHPLADPRAVVAGDRWRITVITDGLLRLEHADDGVFEDRPSTFALHRAQPVPQFRVTDGEGPLELVTARLRLTYDRGPFSAGGLTVAALGGLTSYHSVWRYGETVRDLGGTARTLDGADGAIPLGPGVAAIGGVAVLDDSAGALLAADGTLASRRPGDRQDLYVFVYGHDYPAAVRALYQVSGPPPVLPRWALSNWWSRYHRYRADEYTALLDRFAAEGLPFSVAVLDMDWHRVDDVPPEQGSGWTGYSWDRGLFPDPPAFLADLHARGLRVTLNVHPADGVRAFEDAYPAVCAALGRRPDGDPVAFDVTDPAFLRVYFEVLHRGLERQGVDFWWIDWQSGPYSRAAGVDPLWVLNKGHFEDAARDGRRPLTFSRYAGPGSHRYPVGFSGDAIITWASLAFQPFFTSAAANIGYGWWSHDIGGHMFGVRDDELATRWVQLGVFSPITRLHSTSDPFSSKEPWRFSPHARAVQTRYLRLRARLVPYLHTMNHAAAAGTPLVRPMSWTHPEVPEAYAARTQFWFGSELLVAPVVQPGDVRAGTAAVRTWLPPGTWVDVLPALLDPEPSPEHLPVGLHDPGLRPGLVYDGGREMVLHRALGELPVLAAPGAIVPLDGAAVPGPDPVNPAHLQVLVVVGADGTFELVEDDGTGDGLNPARQVRTPLTYDQASGRFTAGPARGAWQAVPATRTWTVTFVGATGTSVPTVPAVAGVRVRARPGLVSVTVPDVPVAQAVTVGVGPDPTPVGDDPDARVFDLLNAAQVEFVAKERALARSTGDAPLHVRLAGLQALAADAALTSAISEVLLARG